MFDANGIYKKEEPSNSTHDEVKEVSRQEITSNQLVIKNSKKNSKQDLNSIDNHDTSKILTLLEKREHYVCDEAARELPQMNEEEEEYVNDHRISKDVVSIDLCSLNENKENKSIREKNDLSSNIGSEFEASHSKYLKLNDDIFVEKEDDSTAVLNQNISLKKEGSASPSRKLELDSEKLTMTVKESQIDLFQLKSNDFISKLLDEIIERVSKECDPIKCDVCEGQFNSNSELLMHVKIHPKPFKCKVCNKFFATTSHLKRHATSHSGIRPYKCEVCGKDFTQSSNLVRHSKTHKEKTYKWTVCHKLFKTICYSQVHTRSNTGEKSYKCKACNKDFPHSVRLIRHTKVHTLKTPWNFGGKSSSCKKTDDETNISSDKQNEVIDERTESDGDQAILDSNSQNFNLDLSNKDTISYENPSSSVIIETEKG